MSVASRMAAPDVTVAKVFGSSVPPAIEAAVAAAQMTPSSPFSPGEPIGPYDGFSRTPRSHEFVTSVNTSARPRSHERVSFETLKGLIRSYDVAQLCIRHRISSLRSLDWKLIAADHFDGDVNDAITIGMAALKRPDRKTLFKPWLAKYLRGILSFDAGTLYRMRNRGGRVVGLKVIDGTTIAPLMDYWGDSPDSPAPAYVQYANGLPWDWLTRDDIIYEPYDPQDDSIYGRAPLEDILLNANTDIRFQLYFLQRFTEGNLPHAFASAPETWTPDQIEQFQEYWDGFMQGDQSRKHQIRWVPGGSSFAWSDEKEFTDHFSLFLMRKTCAAYSVVPSDLGFTESVNRSSGESQADVQHRVGDLPLAHHVQDILSAFLQDDLGLPLKFSFDLGEEQDDRKDQAEADKDYIDRGVVGPSEIREMRYGLTDPVPIPRFIYTERSGPIPVSSLMAVAGQVDPQTGNPQEGAALPRTVFGGTEGVLPNPPIKVMSLAEQEYGESAMPPAPPPQPQMQPSDATGAPVAKEGEGAPAPGITSETGIYSYDLVRALDEDGDSDDASVAKEMTAFRRYSKARRKAREWRDFEFRAIGKTRGHNLNDSGRLAVRKDAGEIAVAGLAVLAADTGRVLMLQRALVDDDPAAGTWEFPGGHLEGAESPLAAAWREWQEETGSACAPGVQTGSWTSGIYQGIVWTIEREAMIPVRSDSVITNPDDPDADQVEAIAWWDPETLSGNPAVRPELLAAIDDVLAALGCAPGDPAEGDESTCPCGTPVVYDEINGWQHADGSISHDDGESVSDKMAAIAKARDARPKGWPGWKLDLRAAGYWQPFVTASAQQSLTRDRLGGIADGYIADNPGQDGDAPGKRDRNAAALAWLLAQGVAVPMGDVAQGITADAAMIGGASAQAAVNGQDDADTGDWDPGDPVTARQVAEGLGVAAVLALMPGGDGSGGGAAADVADALEDGYLNVVARVLAGWDPDVAADELADMLAESVADGAYAEGLTVTQITTVSGDSAMEYYLANSVGSFQWLVDDSPNVCPVCLANERAGAIPAGTAWPSGARNVPQHPRCFPAGVLVTGPSAVAATARRYEGDLVTIVFADGQEVPVTPNHPVLTPDGWVAAGDLREGSEVLRAADADRVAARLIPHDRQAVARIEDVARALGELGPVLAGLVPLAAEDFHGDGSGDDYVEVVRAAGDAVRDLQPEAAKKCAQCGLPLAAWPALLGGGDLQALGLGGNTATARLVGGAEHDSPLSLGGALPAQMHGGRSVAPVDSRSIEHPVDGAPADAVLSGDGLSGHAACEVTHQAGRSRLAPAVGGEPVSQRDATPDQVLTEGLTADVAHGGACGDGGTSLVLPDRGVQLGEVGHLPSWRQSGRADMFPESHAADADHGRALAHRLSGLVGVECVAEVRRESCWAGHVYNLETVSGWYFANGIIAHNCRCSIVPDWFLSGG